MLVVVVLVVVLIAATVLLVLVGAVVRWICKTCHQFGAPAGWR